MCKLVFTKNNCTILLPNLEKMNDRKIVWCILLVFAFFVFLVTRPTEQIVEQPSDAQCENLMFTGNFTTPKDYEETGCNFQETKQRIIDVQNGVYSNQY